MTHGRFAIVASGLIAVSTSFGASTANTFSDPSSALRAANPAMLSSGVYLAIETERNPRSSVHALRTGGTDLSKGKPPAVLDARVGPNLRLGDDPALLPDSQTSQAEPHVFRSATDPNLLLATFQEGRLTDGGALDCGYSISRDGGANWTRALIPQLTTAGGGPYNRATDPVAAIGPRGELYLNTLASISGSFDLAAVVVSRSTDGGATWSGPFVVFRSPDSRTAPDKNWMAVNDYSGAGTAGRLVVTWTNFTSNASGAATGSNLVSAFSDDRGTTWSTPATITPVGSSNQGTQPVFLPDGSLLVAYATIPHPNNAAFFNIDCKRSTDGGRTYPTNAVTAVSSVSGWSDPQLRNGSFLPSIAVARQSGDVFITYVAIVSGTPRVLITKSSDRGGTWSSPVVVSDNPEGVPVLNPVVAASPDGQAVSVAFLDKRNGDGRYLIDTYAAQSFDGGATWQPNLRLSDQTCDVRYAPQTSGGYMVGDYQGLAPSAGADQPWVAIWCDTRSGDADPFVARYAASETETAGAWSLVNGAPLPTNDTDRDGVPDAVEFRLGTNPRIADAGETFVIQQGSPGVFDVAWIERTNGTGFPVLTVANPPGAGPVSSSNLSGVALSAAQLPKIALPASLQWVGQRFTQAAGAPFTVGHALKFSAGIPPYVSGEIAAANTNARLINVSTRGYIAGGADRMIVGFVTDGAKNMLVRVAGPTLATFGVSNPIPTPVLTLTSIDQTMGATTNTPWHQSGIPASLFSRLGAFAFTAGSADIAFTQKLSANGYTASVSDSRGAAGTALVEAYDADAVPGAPSAPRVVNLSTRGNAGGTGGPLIAGFIITGTQPRRVLIRAVGPGLQAYGVAGALSDPILTLAGTDGVIAMNDDWQISRSWPAIAATTQRLGAFPLAPASLDSAILITLKPGAYTATVTGAAGASGVVLVEVYDAD